MVQTEIQDTSKSMEAIKIETMASIKFLVSNRKLLSDN